MVVLILGYALTYRGFGNCFASDLHITHKHGLQTPNEGINQRNLKIWADVADKICFGRT